MDSDKPPLEDLAHHGVKGMRWGHTKTSGGRESRKQYKTRIATERNDFYNQRANDVLKVALAKGDNVLIKTKLPGDFAHTITTGKEFANHLRAGGAFDVKVTDVFATLNKKQGQFVLNENPTPQFVATPRRKG